ncbi:MAG TPA: PQQ-binding-like beta-propeller repeat protein [Gemmatales bacterium]|nr:PQQ-binding-like beta-propeller repeat protein [Gemmatales bacterium]
MTLTLLLKLTLVTSLFALCHVDNWPQWRGPKADGVSSEKDIVAEWSSDHNILWSMKMPGMGGATPVVWEDKIFVISELANSTMALLCINTSGKELWRRSLSEKKSRRARGDEGNAASASPSTDGKYVYAFVGTGEFTCFDLEGTKIWQFDAQERFGKFNIQFRTSSTPALFQGKLYWQLIDSSHQLVICLDAATGNTIWKVERPSDGVQENEHSYASAQIWQKGDKAYLVVHGNDYTTAHELTDGKELWRVGELNPKGTRYNPTLRFVASPAVSPDLIVIPTAKNGPVVALKPDAQGMITAGSPFELWRRLRETPDVPSPLIHDGLVYLCRENGALICMDATTGKEYYHERIHSARYRASPVYADGKIYCTARDGTVSVFAAGKKFERLSVNKLPDQIAASPVISNGRIYLRGFENLYCIGKK